jgi:putative CocE/NonD family hydrolase
MTRYMRSFEVAPFLSRAVTEADIDPVNGAMRSFFLSHGYAWVDVDVRGSGASFGSWRSPWAPEQVEDGKEILDFIVRQPWSNGVAGATGNSYDGTAAEFLMATGHPALRAVVLRCCLFDTYTDVAYPGGVHHVWFTEAWQRMNSGLDANRPAALAAEAFSIAHPALPPGSVRRAIGGTLRHVVRSVRPVDDDVDRSLLRRAIAEHAANRDVAEAARACTYRDDPDPGGESWTIDTFSPSAKRAALRAADVAVLGISGWFDASYAHAAIKRHRTLGRARDRLVVGPWNHCIRVNASPHAPMRPASFDLNAETLRFFDEHLRGIPTGLEDEPRVRAYEMGAEQWRGHDSWPPPAVRAERLYLGAGGMLRATPPDEPHAKDAFTVDFGAGTGKHSRWRSLVSPFLVPDYRDRRSGTRGELVYVTEPLDGPVSIAGHPVATLHVASTSPDAALFVYLEEVTPDGTVHYVTEGELRLSCRAPSRERPRFDSPVPYRSFLRTEARPMDPGKVEEAAVDLLPVAYRFGSGSRIRLVVGGADADHFVSVGEVGTTLTVARHAGAASGLTLPVLGGAPRFQ